MRKLFSTGAAFLLLGALVAQAQPPDAKGTGTGKGIGKGGGYAPKNLQVLRGGAVGRLRTSLRTDWASNKSTPTSCPTQD